MTKISIAVFVACLVIGLSWGVINHKSDYIFMTDETSMTVVTVPSKSITLYTGPSNYYDVWVHDNSVLEATVSNPQTKAHAIFDLGPFLLLFMMIITALGGICLYIGHKSDLKGWHPR